MREQTTNRGESRKCKNRTPWELVDVNTRDRYGKDFFFFIESIGHGETPTWEIHTYTQTHTHTHTQNNTHILVFKNKITKYEILKLIYVN